MVKRKPPLKASKATWTDSNVVALLSWLDYCLKHEDLDYFESTVVSHMNQKYTLRQIDRKFSSLWTAYGPPGLPGWPVSLWKKYVFKDGSACFNNTSGLRQDILERIAKAVATLEDANHARSLQPAPRRLRSSSKQNESPVSNPTTGSSQRTTRTPQKQRFRPWSKSLTPSAVKREIEQVHLSGETYTSAKKRQQKLPIKPAKAARFTTRPKATGRLLEQGEVLEPSQQCFIADSDHSDDELSELSSGDVEDYRNIQGNGLYGICGATEPDKDRDSTVNWIKCDSCHVRQHANCFQNSLNGPTIPDKRFCQGCKPTAKIHSRNSRSSSQTVDQQSTEPFEPNPELGSVAPTARHEQITFTISSPAVVEPSETGIDVQLRNAIEKIDDLEEERLDLKLDLSYRDAEIKSLKREIASLRDSQRERDDLSGVPIEHLMERTLNLEKKLLANLKAREHGAKFTTLTTSSREWFGSTKVDEGFCDTHSQSRQTLCRQENETVPFVPDLDKQDDLRSLVCRCLTISTETPKELKEATRKLFGLSSEVVVRSLITSALAEWVFDTDFPKFDDGSSEVLEKYRELLRMQVSKMVDTMTDGAATLRNLDLAARDAMTKSSIFRQQKIPAIAKSFAIKISQILAPLFSDTPDRREEKDWDGFATWRDDKEEWTDRRTRFTQMFKFALETKADSCLNIQDYELVIYPPGTMFDKRTMEVGGGNHIKGDPKAYEGRLIDLCIEAAVFAHPRQELSEDSSIAEAIVSSKNFVRKGKKDRVGIEPTVKAVVILSDA